MNTPANHTNDDAAHTGGIAVSSVKEILRQAVAAGIITPAQSSRIYLLALTMADES